MEADLERGRYRSSSPKGIHHVSRLVRVTIAVRIYSLVSHPIQIPTSTPQGISKSHF